MGKVLHLLPRRARDMRDVHLFDVSNDPRDRPIYNVAEAAAYVGVPRGTLRHWITPPRSDERALIEIRAGRLSFFNLLEAHVLRVAVNRKVWLSRLRRGVQELRKQRPNEPHPLLLPELRTASGYRNLYIETVAGDIANLSYGGQFEFRQILARHLQRIDFDESGPFRLRPLWFRRIGLDHRVLAGQPAILNTRISVEVLKRRNRGGDSIDALAREYDIDRAAVREAIKYAA